MKDMIRRIAIIILYFVGISAIIGSWGLVNDPSGQTLDLPQSILQNTPFQNFFYPGLILFLVIGIGSLIIGSLVILKARYYPVLIIAQGLVLTCWIIIQALLLHLTNGLHLFYGANGISLILAGIYIYEWDLHGKVSNRNSYT